MSAQPPSAKAQTRKARGGCLAVLGLIVLIVVIVVIAEGGGSKSSPQSEARSYIKDKTFQINKVRATVETIEGSVGLIIKHHGGSESEVNELARNAQSAHNSIDEVRSELFKVGGNEELSHATLSLQEGANELKNAMGALVAYAGSPNPATLAHLSTQLEKGKEEWNMGAEKVWQIAAESNPPKL
jgi:hypothetical protein